MRFFASAFVFLCLASAPLTQAYATACHDDFLLACKRPTAQAFEVARALAEAEGPLHASTLAAHIFVGLVGEDATVHAVAISERQRDAVLDVLHQHKYFDHLANLYASNFRMDALRELASLYADARMAGLWRFHSAVAGAILSLAPYEVTLPESRILPDAVDMPPCDTILQLVSFWYPEAEHRLDVDDLVTSIRARITTSDTDAAWALSQTHIAAALRDARRSSAYTNFDRIELENPRLRYALARAVLWAE